MINFIYKHINIWSGEVNRILIKIIKKLIVIIDILICCGL